MPDQFVSVPVDENGVELPTKFTSVAVDETGTELPTRFSSVPVDETGRTLDPVSRLKEIARGEPGTHDVELAGRFLLGRGQLRPGVVVQPRQSDDELLDNIQRKVALGVQPTEAEGLLSGILTGEKSAEAKRRFGTGFGAQVAAGFASAPLERGLSKLYARGLGMDPGAIDALQYLPEETLPQKLERRGASLVPIMSEIGLMPAEAAPEAVGTRAEQIAAQLARNVKLGAGVSGIDVASKVAQGEAPRGEDVTATMAGFAAPGMLPRVGGALGMVVNPLGQAAAMDVASTLASGQMPTKETLAQIPLDALLFAGIDALHKVPDVLKPVFRDALLERVKTEYTSDQMRAIYLRVNRGEATSQEESLVRQLNAALEHPGEAARHGVRKVESRTRDWVPGWLAEWAGVAPAAEQAAEVVGGEKPQAETPVPPSGAAGLPTAMELLGIGDRGTGIADRPAGKVTVTATDEAGQTRTVTADREHAADVAAALSKTSGPGTRVDVSTEKAEGRRLKAESAEQQTAETFQAAKPVTFPSAREVATQHRHANEAVKLAAMVRGKLDELADTPDAWRQDQQIANWYAILGQRARSLGVKNFPMPEKVTDEGMLRAAVGKVEGKAEEVIGERESGIADFTTKFTPTLRSGGTKVAPTVGAESGRFRSRRRGTWCICGTNRVGNRSRRR